MPAQPAATRKVRTTTRGIKERKEPTVQLNLSISRSMFTRLVACARKESLLNEQEAVRVGLADFLRRGGY